MIVRIHSYRVCDGKVVYLDTEKIWSFSFETKGDFVIFEAYGKVIFKDYNDYKDDSNFMQYYFALYEDIKSAFWGEPQEIYTEV